MNPPQILAARLARVRAIQSSPAASKIVVPLLVCAFVASLSKSVFGAVPASAASAEGVEFFETHIRPVLAENCYECHSADSKVLQGGLRLDTAERTRAGGDSGPAVVPQKPAESLLLAAIKYESFEMPPTGKLPEAVIRDFEKWIALGAPDPRVESKTTAGSPADGEQPVADPRQHWAFRPPQRVSPPPVKSESAAQTDLDRYVSARLEAANLTPSPLAAPRTLLRRLYYDLIGLPPTAAELAEFSADATDARYEATVDRLLASPRFGERWARHWLDIARYADTKGYVFQEDRSYKHAYTYRDWVIGSFNTDRPFNQFIVAQLAGDQIGDPSCAPASGFLTLGRRFLKNQQEIINDRIDVVTRGLMGLTVACARCHDHKYDPISAADYYAMYGVFASSEEKERESAPPELNDAATPYEPFVFLRGNAGNRGPSVPRRFMTILTADGNPQPFQKGSGRLEMAEAIASRDNPLTARVWVNRVWGHLFGTPLVATPSDFGVRGTPPTHPELLDWLACELVDNGWSTKRLIRRIVLSGTYRQASDVRAECVAVDADNKLLWRANRRRLDLEQMRDTMLVSAGRLDETMGGPSVSLTDAPFSTRRSVYGYIERQNLPAFFRTFDFANPNTHTPERPSTTSPQQALFLMNSPYVMEQAIKLAERTAFDSELQREDRVLAGSPDSATQATAGRQEVPGQETRAQPQESQSNHSAAHRLRRINRMYQFTLGRDAHAEELADAIEFVDLGEPATTLETQNQLAWQFGWGTVDDASAKVQFQPLPHFTGSAWQGGKAWPDPTLGYAMLNEDGGHPGDALHLVVRRWTSPAAGTVHIEGAISHNHQLGDGVRGRVIASRGGVKGEWIGFQNQAATVTPEFEVEAGDTIDFVTDCRAGIDNDSFAWSITLRLTPASGEGVQLWDSTNGFHGPVIAPLSRWEQLAQVILMSNEFMFVD